MIGKGKEELVNKDENSENWCFVCKDGGALRICDYKQCLKSYHYFCVRKDESFLESEKTWDCAWHRCLRCRRSSHLHCYTCEKSVCRYCLSTAKILQVKGQYGFCKDCLKLALLIEEKRSYDSDGGKVDFTDRETFEGLHMEYYMIVKKNEGFELADIYAAKERVKEKKSHEAESGSEDFDEEKEPISDYYDLEVQKKKRRRSQNKSNGRKPAKPTPTKSYKKEFIGWASKALIEFLGSIGKSTDEKLSQHEVTSIVNEYVKEKKLLNPHKKRFVKCDALLHSLFRKKTIDKSRIHTLLKGRFAENHEESEEDDNVRPDSEENLGTLNPCKRQRKTGAGKKSMKKDDVESNVPLKSRFASIVVENLKLVYLGRGVLKEMLKEAETFAEKVTGCFVRVKSDPYDHRSRSHQLVQVKGVKTVSVDENNTETVLLLSALPNEIRIPLVSDEGITESIRKELNLLKNLIERANEKGWRRDMFEHLERKKTLQSPTEQSRLLENVPAVIADVYEPTPESNPTCDSPVPGDGQQEEENSRDAQISPSEKDQTVSVPKEPQQGPTPDSEPKQAKEKECEDLKIEVIAIPDDYKEEDSKAGRRVSENETWCMRGPEGALHKSIPLSVFRLWSERSRCLSEFKVWREDECEEDAIPLPEALSIASRKK